MDRRERLRKLALETIDLSKDPYFMRNHLGSYECKLCATLHTNEGSYLAHTQGKKHQVNMKRRLEMQKNMDLSTGGFDPDAPLGSGMVADKQSKPREAPAIKPEDIPERFRMPVNNIGRPGYKVSKMYCPESDRFAILFQLDYLEVDKVSRPYHRFVSAFEQKVEAPRAEYQYILFACKPYETIGFRFPNNFLVDRTEENTLKYWDESKKVYYLQFFLNPMEARVLPGLSKQAIQTTLSINGTGSMVY